MMDDEHHEAMGAMIHRGLVEKATNTRNYHKEQKAALDVAIEALQYIKDNCREFPSNLADEALKSVERILKL